MSTKQEVLWMIDNLCVTHTGFDTLALKKMVEKLDDRHLILEEDDNGVVTATIKASSKVCDTKRKNILHTRI